MNTITFDRLSRVIGVIGSRRAAFRTMLGAGLLGTTQGPAAAKGNAHGKRKKNSRDRVSARRRTSQGNHCITPSGADLNAVFGIPAQIVAQNPPEPPFFQGCDKVGTGERWTVAQQTWIMPPAFVEVPSRWAPAGETPLADFLAKFTGVKYVIDRGTKRERTVVIPTNNDLFVVDADEGFVVVRATPLGTLRPLPVGPHKVEAYWMFSAMHCDGLGPDPALQCFAAGETLLSSVKFRVTPGHN
jgi:hypothetical protein